MTRGDNRQNPATGLRSTAGRVILS